MFGDGWGKERQEEKGKGEFREFPGKTGEFCVDSSIHRSIGNGREARKIKGLILALTLQEAPTNSGFTANGQSSGFQMFQNPKDDGLKNDIKAIAHYSANHISD